MAAAQIVSSIVETVKMAPVTDGCGRGAAAPSQKRLTSFGRRLGATRTSELLVTASSPYLIIVCPFSVRILRHAFFQGTTTFQRCLN